MYSVKHYYVLYHFRILRAWNPTFSKNIYVAPTNYWGQYAKYFVYVNRLIYMPKILRVLVTQSCPTLCDPLDCSLPGFSICGIFQARILEWIAISFSRGSSWPRYWTQVSWIAGRLFTVWATKKEENGPQSRQDMCKKNKLQLARLWLRVKQRRTLWSPHMSSIWLLSVGKL